MVRTLDALRPLGSFDALGPFLAAIDAPVFAAVFTTVFAAVGTAFVLSAQLDPQAVVVLT